MQCATQVTVLYVAVAFACRMFLPLDYSYVSRTLWLEHGISFWENESESILNGREGKCGVSGTAKAVK